MKLEVVTGGNPELQERKNYAHCNRRDKRYRQLQSIEVYCPLVQIASSERKRNKVSQTSPRRRKCRKN